MTKLDRAERKLRPEDGERNIERPMVKLHYDGNEKSTSCVKVTEVPVEKVKKKKYSIWTVNTSNHSQQIS